MANVNKVILVGRLTRDPEVVNFNSGAKMAKFGFAVSNRRKNQQTGQWEDFPVFVDCKVFQAGNSKSADNFVQYTKKGDQVYLEGKLEFEQWTDKTTGDKRTKLSITVENYQFLQNRRDDNEDKPFGQNNRNQGSGPASGNGYNGNGNGNSGHGGQGSPVKEPSMFGDPAPGNGSDGGFDGYEGDIPF